MARATTKEPETSETPPEESDGETQETPSEEKEGLSEEIKSFITETVEKVLGDKVKPGEGTATKRPTYRDEEESMADQVSAKIEELLKKERAANEKHPEPSDEKAKPEPVPAQPEGRRVEKLMGWN